jgi:hypothetical protein
MFQACGVLTVACLGVLLFFCCCGLDLFLSVLHFSALASVKQKLVSHKLGKTRSSRLVPDIFFSRLSGSLLM